MADSSQGRSNRRPGCRTRVPMRGKIGGPTRVATRSLWRGRAKPVRRDLIMGLDGGCHDVSVIGGGRLGPGGKTAILTMRPW
jgi:hypothetical protein